MTLTIIAFLAVLLVLIVAHELGHFATAKLSKVKVDEFSIGFPPRIFSVKRGETKYSIGATLLGGFVKLAGEEDSNVQGGLSSKGYGTRILVLSSGALMNLLLPIVLFTVAFMVPHTVVTGEVAVSAIAPDSPASRVGITEGDIILEVDGKPVGNVGDLHRFIQLNLGQSTTLLVKQGEALRELQIVPRWQPPEGQGAIGVSVRLTSPKPRSESYPVWRAVPLGFRELIDTFVLFKNSIIGMFIGTEPAMVTGPVGIAQITGEVAKAGVSPLLEFAAFLSINLAIINILPLPALDGGRIAFVLLEWIRRGKKISAKTEGLVHLIGFAMLIALALAVTYQDILRIITGESLLP